MWCQFCIYIADLYKTLCWMSWHLSAGSWRCWALAYIDFVFPIPVSCISPENIERWESLCCWIAPPVVDCTFYYTRHSLTCSSRITKMAKQPPVCLYYRILYTESSVLICCTQQPASQNSRTNCQTSIWTCDQNRIDNATLNIKKDISNRRTSQLSYKYLYHYI